MPAMDQIRAFHRFYSSTTQLRSNPHFEVKRHQIAFVYEDLVGAVGIENTTDRNPKDLEEMLRSAKALKRNNRESKVILIGPSMAPRSLRAQIPSAYLSHCSKSVVGFGPNFAARMASRRQNFS
jgi:hypothetical protein